MEALAQFFGEFAEFRRASQRWLLETLALADKNDRHAKAIGLAGRLAIYAMCNRNREEA